MESGTIVHHITLSVTNLDRSTEWYCAVLDGLVVGQRSGEGFTRNLVRLPSGLIIGLTQHKATRETDRFDPSRVGLDHLSLAVGAPSDVRDWAAELEARRIPHDPIVTAASATLVVCYDPDGIPIEVYAPTP
ncbi:MAG: VOC family protein [Actinobacteria bacterium]|nr:VOC family protein [Actinomycetota bacterium]